MRKSFFCVIFACCLTATAHAEKIYHYGVGSLLCGKYNSASEKNKYVFYSYAQGWLSALGYKAAEEHKQPEKIDIPLYLNELSEVCASDPSMRFMQAVGVAHMSYIIKQNDVTH